MEISMATKARLTLRSQNRGHHQTIDATTGALLAESWSENTFLDYQRTSSDGHPYKWSAAKKKLYLDARTAADSGGPFETRISECDPGGFQVSLSRNTGSAIRKYDGEVYAWRSNYAGQNTDIPAASSDAQLDAYGATAISRCIPTNPLSGMGQFLGELHEGLPRKFQLTDWKRRANPFKDLRSARLLKRGSSDWLNFQFGWLPFANDVINFVDVTNNADKHMEQYYRDSGRSIRRRYVFPDTTSTTIVDFGNSYQLPSLDSYLVLAPGKLTRTTTITAKRWFSGAFTYYLPKGNKLALGEAMAAKLYGLRLTPHLFYQLVPWSWALDWVSNFGSVIKNVSAFANDGLVMRYGYMMETSTVEVVYALNGLSLWGQPPINLTQTFRTQTKKRRRATPFGFGLNSGSFTARQWSIIAALGISKSPRSLNF